MIFSNRKLFSKKIKRWNEFLSRYIIMVIISCLMISVNINAQNKQTTQEQLKAAYIFSFIPYITWENENSYKDFQIVQFGDDEKIYKELVKLSKLDTDKGKPIVVSKINSLSSLDLDKVRILYLSSVQIDNINYT